MHTTLTIKILEGVVIIHAREDRTKRTRLEEGVSVNATYDAANDWIFVPAHEGHGLPTKTWKLHWDNGQVEVFQDFFADNEEEPEAA